MWLYHFFWHFLYCIQPSSGFMDRLINHSKLSFSEIFSQNKVTKRQLWKNRIWCFSIFIPWITCWFLRRKLCRLRFLLIIFKSINFGLCTMDLFIIASRLIFRNIQGEFVFIEPFIIARFLVFWRIIFIIIFLLESFDVFFSLWSTVDLTLNQKINFWFFLFFFRLQPSFSFFF